MRRILKYEIKPHGGQIIEFNGQARILCVGVQDNKPYIWADVSEKLLYKEKQKKEMRPITHKIITTSNPDPHSWINQFLNDDNMKPETKDRIIFKFGEFIGRVCKEEKTSYNEVVKVLLEIVEQNIKKK